MSEISFEESMKKLDGIVTKLERNDGSLDDSITNFEQGLKLVKKLDQQLKSYEDRVAQIIADNKD